MTTPAIVLASTSRYRAGLLGRLLGDFMQAAPGVDEAPLGGESAPARALRLAVAKAGAVAASHPGTLVIGSDQVAELGGEVLDKPGSEARAVAQLRASSGRRVRFHTAVCLLDARDGSRQTHVDLTTVDFRTLTPEEIARYVAREQPLDCAGSFKCEGLGIGLFERIGTEDPSALVGLPLIALAGMLRHTGIAVP